jgi:four helix bundle protein
MENNIILNKSYAFACEVILYAREVPPDSKALAFQLIRSGSSIGASVTEAQSAESKSDFVHKLKIADKEARETLYWLNLLQNVDRGGDQGKLRSDLEEVQCLLSSIISTCKKSMAK